MYVSLGLLGAKLGQSESPGCAPSANAFPARARSSHRDEKTEVQFGVAAVHLIPLFDAERPENRTGSATSLRLETGKSAADTVKSLCQRRGGRTQFSGCRLGQLESRRHRLCQET